MTTEVVLRADTISKKFSTGTRRAMYHATADIARELAWWRTIPAATRPGEFWALKDVSLELARGKAVAIIGANGAGKSTLLKLLSGLLKPDTGRVVVRGRLRAMIELGAGFAPSLSGRDNVYAQASLYGYRRRDLKSNLESIVEFSGLESFIDAPVQQYSDGMRARLGFAIAIHLDPDLLLVDEVLAVGDMAFQNKCLAFIRGYLERGGALVFVGHGSHQIQAVCTEGLVLVRGETKFTGSVTEALDFYLRSARVESEPSVPAGWPGVSGAPAGIRIDRLEIVPVGSSAIRTGGAVRLALRYTAGARVQNVGLGFTIYSVDSGACLAGGAPRSAVTLQKGSHSVSCIVPYLPVLGGEYLVRAYLFNQENSYPLATIGWDEPAEHMIVESDPSPLANLSRIAGMQVGIESVWEVSQN